ncbi:MAG: pentapeptide repeat-containing protein [Okeania sp. SIO2D1]|nr:pentapeptide repeat-containing protein [Okeania sp. SIO2D1]
MGVNMKDYNYINKDERKFQRVNLRGLSFKGKDLSDEDFSFADIRGTNFSEATLIRTKFQGAQGGLPLQSVINLAIVLLLLFLLLTSAAAIAGGFAGDQFAKNFFPKDAQEASQITDLLASAGILLTIIAFLFFIIFMQGLGEIVLITFLILAIIGAVTWSLYYLRNSEIVGGIAWVFPYLGSSKLVVATGLSAAWGGGGIIAGALFSAVCGTAFGAVLGGFDFPVRLSYSWFALVGTFSGAATVIFVVCAIWDWLVTVRALHGKGFAVGAVSGSSDFWKLPREFS